MAKTVLKLKTPLFLIKPPMDNVCEVLCTVLISNIEEKLQTNVLLLSLGCGLRKRRQGVVKRAQINLSITESNDFSIRFMK